MARVASGKITLERAAVDLGDVAARCLDALAQAGRTRGTRVARRRAGAAWTGDATRLEQVVANLLDNALKYTPPGGRVTVLDRAAPATRRCCGCADTGSGIRAGDPAARVRPVRPGPQALDRSRGGLGLGLTLVKRLVELHGGTVSAASAGPATAASSSCAARARRGGAAPGAAHGAVAGTRRPPPRADRRGQRRRARGLRLCSSWPATRSTRPRTARRRRELRGVPARRRADRLGLPGLDGYEVARRTRERAEHARPLLVALTGYGQPEDRRRALAAGFDGHLTKPVDPAVLLDLLRVDTNLGFPDSIDG